MFYKLISYLKFLLKSTNQHGVHSPFVYDLVTKCLYKPLKQKKGLDKTEIVLHKLISYFNPKQILIIGENNSALKLNTDVTITHKNPKETVDYNLFDGVYLDHPNTLQITEKQIYTIPNDTFVFVKNINTSEENNLLWKKAISNPNITVSIDCFWFGLLFCRKEQVKENFIIRA